MECEAGRSEDRNTDIRVGLFRGFLESGKEGFDDESMCKVVDGKLNFVSIFAQCWRLCHCNFKSVSFSQMERAWQCGILIPALQMRTSRVVCVNFCMPALTD